LEIAFGGRHVAGDHRDRRLGGLDAQLLDHRARQLDARDRHAALSQRDGDAAGADGELQRPAATSQLGEPVHGRP
jgi:hypothetical protein